MQIHLVTCQRLCCCSLYQSGTTANPNLPSSYHLNRCCNYSKSLLSPQTEQELSSKTNNTTCLSAHPHLSLLSLHFLKKLVDHSLDHAVGCDDGVLAHGLARPWVCAVPLYVLLEGRSLQHRMFWGKTTRVHPSALTAQERGRDREVLL